MNSVCTLYNISIWKLHPMFFSRLTWWKSVVRYFLHLSRDNRLYDEYNLTSDVLLFFQSNQTVRYNEIFKYYLEIIWYEIIHQQIENMMSKSKKTQNDNERSKMTTDHKRAFDFNTSSIQLLRTILTLSTTLSYCFTLIKCYLDMKAFKKRYWLNIDSFHTWSSAIGRYQIRMLHETRLLNRIQCFQFSSVLI